MGDIMKSLFNKFDLNKDGMITSSELTQVYGNMYPTETEAETKGRVQTILNEMDKNHDDEISWEEFRSTLMGKDD